MLSMLNNNHGMVDGRDETEQMHVQVVSGTYFPTLGVQPVIGRALTDDDDNSEGDHPVAVSAMRWWKRALAGDPDVLNHKVKLGSTHLQYRGRRSAGVLWNQGRRSRQTSGFRCP